MAYADKVFTRELTDDEEQAVLSFTIDEAGIDREFLQAVDGIINHCKATYDANIEAAAKATIWDALSPEDQAAAVTAAKAEQVGPIGPPIKNPPVG